MNFGRTEIFTDYKEITRDNIISVLQDAMSIHSVNANKMESLLNYEAGNQPLNRVKTYRPEINAVVCDNLANEITEFKCGFIWGNPITLVQRGSNDKGDVNEPKAIALLNECYEADNIKAKTQKIAYFTEITGICYEYIDINADYVEGDSPFTTTVLDPRTSFIVKSSYFIDRRDMLGVTYRVTSGGVKHFTCITKDSVFTITDSNIDSVELNPFGIINMVEWKRSVDRMGCFERQIPELDNLNLLVSDFTNDVDQNTQCVMFGVDLDFPKDENGNDVKPQSGEWLLAYSTENGKPSLQPIATQYDYSGMLNNIVTRRSLILQKCNVPQRNDNSGGSTGIAMSDATGWSAAEMSACKEQPLQEESKMKEVKIVLAIIKMSPFIASDNLMLNLKYSDVQPNIKRLKSYELTVKANAYATFVKHGVNQLDTLKLIDAFDDPQQVHEDSKDEWKAFMDSNFKVEVSNDRTMSDYSDQEENSPMMK